MKKLIPLSLITIISLNASSLQTILVEEKYEQRNSKDIENANIRAMDIGDILSKNLTTISHIRKAGIANDIILRGLSKDNINVLIDDQRVCGACPNRMDPPSFHISQSLVESVEIKEGPFDVENSGSMGGVVNIKTATPKNGTFGEVLAKVASFGYYEGAIKANVGSDSAKVLMSYDYKQSDPYKTGAGIKISDIYPQNSPNRYIKEDKYSVANYTIKSQFKPNENSTLNINGSYNDANDILYPALKMDALYDRTKQMSADYRYNFDGLVKNIIISAYTNSVEHDMRDSLRASSTNFSTGFSMKTVADTTTTGAKITTELKDLKLGIDYISRNWVADNYLMGGKYLNNMIPDVDINTIGTFIKHELKKDNFKIDSGLRLDFVSSKANEKIDAIELKRGVVDSSPNDTMVSGNAIFTYYLNDDTDMFVGVGHSQRTPDAQERFMNLKRPIMGKMEPNLNSFWIGNPDLKPTKNSELDVGISADLNRFSYSIKGFYSMLNDYITLDSFNNNGVDKTITYSNIDAIIYGATINLGYNIDNLFAKSSITAQRGKRDDDSSKDKDLAEIPPLKSNLQIGYEDKKLLAMLEFQGATSQNRINEELGEKEIAGYIIENIKFSYNFNKNIKLDIAVDNLFDKDYAVHNSYIRDPFSSGIVVNEPQRTYYGAIKYSF